MNDVTKMYQNNFKLWKSVNFKWSYPGFKSAAFTLLTQTQAEWDTHTYFSIPRWRQSCPIVRVTLDLQSINELSGNKVKDGGGGHHLGLNVNRREMERVFFILCVCLRLHLRLRLRCSCKPTLREQRYSFLLGTDLRTSGVRMLP